jgi:hypothetical protein
MLWKYAIVDDVWYNSRVSLYEIVSDKFIYRHDGCLLSLYSCDTFLVGWTDEAKVKWLQHAAMAKDELQGMRLSVTSSCMKHDGCLLSQQFVTWLVCKYIINNTLCSIALFNLGPHSFYLRIEGSIYTV